MFKSWSILLECVMISCIVSFGAAIYFFWNSNYTNDHNFNNASHFTIDAVGNVYFLASKCILKYDLSKKSSDIWGSCDKDKPSVPFRMAVSPQGQFYGVYYRSDTKTPAYVKEFDKNGNEIRYWDLYPSPNDFTFDPTNIVVDEKGMVFLLEEGRSLTRILEYDGNGNFINGWSNFDADFKEKYKVFDLTDSAGNIYLANTYSVKKIVEKGQNPPNLIEKIDSTGKVLTKWEVKIPAYPKYNALPTLYWVTIDKQGKVYALVQGLASEFTSYLLVYDNAGNLLQYAPSTQGYTSIYLNLFGMVGCGLISFFLLVVGLILFLKEEGINQPS